MSIVKRTHGTQGKSVTVVTNSFEITRLPTKSYYMYDGMSVLVISLVAANAIPSFQLASIIIEG